MSELMGERGASIESINIGDGITVGKTISETDVYLFAGITGDFSPNHVNASYMRNSPFEERIAHGALVLGFTSTAAAMFGIKYGVRGVSAGYDHVRFLTPVRFGDTIEVEYRVSRVDLERRRTHADVRVTNQNGELVLVGENIIKFLDYSTPGQRDE